MTEETDPLMSGPEAVEAVCDEKISYSTFWRWTQVGIKAGDRRIRLGFVKAGGKRKTSPGRVREFVAACAEATSGQAGAAE